MVGHIIVAILLAFAVFALFRSHRFMRSDASGPDAVAIYAAAVSMRGVALFFAMLAGIVFVVFQWLI